MGTITGALIKGASVAIGSTASVVSGAVGGAVGVIAKEAIAPRGTVTEADEQRAIRQTEATRQWQKEQKDKANKNPNLDYPASRQIVEARPSDAGFTGGQESGVSYKITVTWKEYNNRGASINGINEVIVPGAIPRPPKFYKESNSLLVNLVDLGIKS